MEQSCTAPHLIRAQGHPPSPSEPRKQHQARRDDSSLNEVSLQKDPSGLRMSGFIKLHGKESPGTAYDHQD